MTVYIAGAENEIEWAEAVDRLIADGVIDGPDARGLTADEFQGADADTIRRDVEDVLGAGLVLQVGEDAGIAATVAGAAGIEVVGL